KPVKVRALLPWCMGGKVDGGLSLGPRTGDARVLRYPDQRGGGTGPIIETLQAATSSDWLTALVNPSNGQSVVMGFLSAEQAWPRIDLGYTTDVPDPLNPIRAHPPYEPALELAPGERLDSEVL